MRMMPANLKGAVLMTAAMAAFVLNDTCMKAVSADLSLYQSIFLRGMLTTLGLLLIAARMGGLRLSFPAGAGPIVALRSAAEVGGTVAFLTALMHLPLATLTAIMQVLPVAVTLAAALVFGEALTLRRILATAAGFCGVMLIIRPGTDGFTAWGILGLLSVAAVVLRDLSTRALPASIASVTVALIASVSVTAFALMALPFTEWRELTPGALVLVATASAFLLSGYILVVAASRVGDVGAVAPFRYTALVFAIITGWLIFGHLPDSLTLAGAAIVVLAGLAALSNGRRRAPAAAAQEPTENAAT